MEPVKRYATITYDVATPESAENGDVSELGFYAPGGWKFPAPGCHEGKPGDNNLATSEVLYWAQQRVAWRDNGDGSFYCEDRDENYQTGEDTSYAVHFSGVTAASLGRIARVLGC
jgi:hypothetical protein